jgi:hypothetical protein
VTQHRCARENSLERLHSFESFWDEREFDFEFALFVFLKKRRQIDWCLKKVVHEASIKVCKFDEELYIFMRFE